MNYKKIRDENSTTYNIHIYIEWIKNSLKNKQK